MIEVRIPANGGILEGRLDVPDRSRALVLFAHGSGSSRHSSRNIQVAAELQDAGLATMLFDLLTHEEEEIDRYTMEFRFSIDLLERRLVTATHWARSQTAVAGMHIGYFGASTGSAAALKAAAQMRETIGAVVSRGGRPDMAGAALAQVI